VRSPQGQSTIAAMTKLVNSNGEINSVSRVFFAKAGEETSFPDTQLIFQVGDIAYDLEQINGTVGDNYFRALEPFSTRLPWMVWIYSLLHFVFEHSYQIVDGCWQS
jgi:hypothetical protein